MKEDLLLIGSNTDFRFINYMDVCQELGINFINLNHERFGTSKFKIPNLTKAKVKIFSPWKSRRTIDLFHEMGGCDGGFKVNTGNNFFANQPKTTDGFKKYLLSLEELIGNSIGEVDYMNLPQEIFIGRDKQVMYEFFVEKKIPGPKYCGVLNDSEELWKKHLNTREEYFVKLHSGSLGKGIAILKEGNLGTTISRKGSEFCHDKKFYVLNDEKEILKILDFLKSMGSVVQERINIDTIAGKHYDIRQQVAFGELDTTIMRIGDLEVTNVALGAEEVSGRGLEKVFTDYQLNYLNSVGNYILKQFKSRDLGIDVCFDKERKNIYCLEVNFLPGLEGFYYLQNKEIIKWVGQNEKSIDNT